MHISRLEIENIKSYRKASFEMTRGTTAITGRNGAGKTTIIEAIAWVLFDHLEYKKDDFVRRGEKKGWARVTFESGLDEREYVVYRDTGTGYYVLDPRIDTRIAEKKEEVQRFLWTHLGLEPGTDLKTLFRQAIGVPQGTFTAIFLEGSTERKAAFDRLLKVEEYRQAAEKLRETVRYIDARIADVREATARAEGELARGPQVEAEHREQSARLEALKKEIAGAQKLVNEKRHIVETLNELELVERSIDTVTAERLRLEKAIASLERAHEEANLLRPKVTEQTEIESSVSSIREKIAASKAVAENAEMLKGRVERLRSEYRENAERLKAAEARTSEAEQADELSARERSLVQQAADLRAELERDKKFQNEVRNGLCPILSEKCLNLKEGQTLEGFLAGQFDTLTDKIESVEAERKDTASLLAKAREAQVAVAAIDGLRRREAELKAEGTRLADEQRAAAEQIGDPGAMEAELSRLSAKLSELADPRSRLQVLETEIAREPDTRREAAEIEKNLERLASDRALLVEKLEIEDPDHTAGSRYDPKIHAAERSALIEAEKDLAAASALTKTVELRIADLAAELDRLREARAAVADRLRERENLEALAQATAFIRDTLKEAAPRVARNYVYHVSAEANQMFRDITGDAERSLVWGDDYAIQIDSGGYRRPFQSLSGGEQMAAALSVRLALLKQLTDIRIAFFDEPTTNMDAERRENLAIEISRVTSFDQLFVISHDETFDNYVDNVISVEP